MTPSNLAARARAALEWLQRLPLRLVLLVALAGAVAGWVRSCNRVDRAETDAARAAETAELRAREIAVAVELERRALAGRLEAAQRWAAGLEDQVRRAREVIPGARPVVVVTGTTGPVQAGGGAPTPAPEPGGGLSVAPPSGAPPPGRVCLLWEGDQGEIRVAGAALRSDAGTVAVVGTTEAWRVEPRSLLFGGPLRLDVAGEKPPRAPGWAYGLGAGASGQGWLLSGLVLTPPWRLPLVGWPARWWVLGAGGPHEGLALTGPLVEP